MEPKSSLRVPPVDCNKLPGNEIPSSKVRVRVSGQNLIFLLLLGLVLRVFQGEYIEFHRIHENRPVHKSYVWLTLYAVTTHFVSN